MNKAEVCSREDFFIVGIGASAGGLEALEQFFANLPEVDNMAFVVIQHLSPDYKSYMPELLSRHTKMKIYQIQNGMKLAPGCIYLNPPKFNVMISEGQLILKDQEPFHKINLAIDTFLQSLAMEAREKSIAIILSGTGSDGTRGCRSIKEAGGIVMAQEEASAKFNGMPRSVISTNACDYIIPPRLMPDELLKYTRQPSSVRFKATEKPKEKEDEGSDILTSMYNIIKKRYLVDFSLYKQSTVLRCIDRRMRISQIQEPEMYLELLKESPNEVERLYSSLLIGVTRFFRDEEAFNVIKNRVIPEIINNKLDNSIIRVWVAGCSTGEEAYSLAILFKEYMDAVQKTINIKIFATDIDNNAIEYASAGIYPDSISHDVSLERLNRYFIKKREAYQVSKIIREMVIFSCHNLINNPPFFKIDLLSCRNLLIYFQPQLQKRILSTFQFAIEINGFMFLGTSETTGELGSYFSTVDAKWKIFKCRESKKRPLIDDVSVIAADMKMIPSRVVDSYPEGKTRSNWEMDDIYAKLIEECLPPSVVVDENGELVQVCGDADRFLKVPRGRVYYDIQKMVPKELSTALGTAISKVRKEKKVVTYTNIKVKLAEEIVCINLIVKPIHTRKSGTLILVIFEESKNIPVQSDSIENYDTVSKLHERIADLEQELQYTKESLQTSIEEIETSSEEIQSANEELLVSNEELHSTNEELQSVNEELIVVNTQYQYKIQELADLNDDMTNFLNSTTIGTIFLDSSLCVRKFTPAITKEVNLIESDIGRPISHISHNLLNEDLVSVAKEVIGTLIPSENEVQSSCGRCYILKCAPYRTNENIIKGVVISLVDITARKAAEEDNVKTLRLLEEARVFDGLKNDFFSNLSHELRTPLNVIMSTLQLLQSTVRSKYKDEADNNLKRYMDIMKQNCFRQLRLINNLIDITKIDSGFFEVSMHNYDIVNIVENITLSVSEYIKAKSINLIFDTDVEEKIIACDPDNIERIMLNLLSNAVKFTGEGGDITVTMYDMEDNVRISVRDSGIGIPQGQLDIIFERFRQVDKSLARGQEGSGIGLSLVKSLVEMHGGSITVRSEYGRGSEFIVELPVRTVPESEALMLEDTKQNNNVEKIHLEFSDIYNLN